MSIVVGVVTAVSETISGVVVGLAATGGEAFVGGARLAGLIGYQSGPGAAGRLLTVAIVAIPLTRIAWRLAHWGAAPIGDDR